MSPSTKSIELAAKPFSDDESRWQSLVDRDPAADGEFVYSVKSTGVYCRPTCPSRLALRENVRFHATCEEAEAAGFRACKRCKPTGESIAEHQSSIVAQACRIIEESGEIPNLDDLARSVGMSSYHFHRVFKAQTGLTPRGYAVAHRTRRVRDELTRRETVTEAIYGAGFNSNSRFYESSDEVLGMTPRTFRDGGSGTTIRFAIGESWLGPILVASSEKGVCAILLGDDPEELVRDLQDRFPKAELIGGDEDFEQLVARVVGFVENPSIRPRSAARHPRHRVPAAGLGGVAPDTRRLDRELRRDRRADRTAQIRACRGPGLRGQSPCGRHPVPPRREDRRRTVRLPLGRRTEGPAAPA